MRFLGSKIRAMLWTISLLLLLSAHGHAQEGAERAVALGRLVEFSAGSGGEKADFDVVSVKLDGKLLKQFAASVSFLKVVATFNGPEGDYVLLRTSMGSGACAGGDLFALRFYASGQGGGEQVGLEVSPKLTACLSEYPWVKFEYDDQGTVIRTAGYELKGPPLTKWTPERRPKKAAGRRR
jgi:hypothetical protein